MAVPFLTKGGLLKHGDKTKEELKNVIPIDYIISNIYNDYINGKNFFIIEAATGSDEYYQLMVFNILDLNILPVDINALTREIPLFYLFNYSSSLDEFITSSMEGYNIDTYTNNAFNRKSSKYLKKINEYIEYMSPGTSDYLREFKPSRDNLDSIKTIYHNKYSHIDPKLNSVSSVWERESGKYRLLFNQFEFLNKFNVFLNFIVNPSIAVNAHKLNVRNSTFDVNRPYRFDYSHYSTRQYYAGVSTDLSKSNTDFYRNLRRNRHVERAEVYRMNSDTVRTIKNVEEYIGGYKKSVKEEIAVITTTVRNFSNFIRNNFYTCMFNLDVAPNRHSIPYSINGHKSFADSPDFEVNLCKNWRHVNETIGPENRPPIVTNTKFILTREFPYFTYYNFSSLVSQIDDSVMPCMTKLQKLENAYFMKTKLNEFINKDRTGYRNAIRYRCRTSWGISNPLYLANISCSELLFRKYPSSIDDVINYRIKNNPVSYSTEFDWYFNNIGSKFHTSNKFLRIKSKCLFNHSLTQSEQLVSTIDDSYFDNAMVTEGIYASDLHAQNFLNNEDARKTHVLSNIMYNTNTFGYIPLRHIMLLDVCCNFIRYKITQENLYTTNKIISGAMLYDTEYHKEKIYDDSYGVNRDSLRNVSVYPRVKAFNSSAAPTS